MTTNEFDEQMLLLKKAVFERKPVLKEILSVYGSKTVSEYLQGIIDGDKSYIDPDRQAEFLKIFRKEVAAKYGEDRAKIACEQMMRNYLVSTSDHTGPLSPPDFVNSHLALANVYADPKNKFKELIILSCSNITLHNLTFPRGMVFSTKTDDLLTVNRLPLISKSMVGYTLYGFKTTAESVFEKVDELLRKFKAEDSSVSKKLRVLMDNFLEDISGDNFYYEFVRSINGKLWKRFFSDKSTDFPNLIYLEQEDLITKLLLENHIHNKTIINDFIFNPNNEKNISELFSGIEGAFDEEKELGTYLFWAIPPNEKYKVSLKKVGDKLVSKDGKYTINLQPNDIADALKNKILIPSALIDFLLLNFYYGVKCLGGTSQINYTTEMKNSLKKFIGLKVDPITQSIVESVPTNLLNCDLYLGAINCADDIAPATGLDLALYLDNTAFEKIGDISKTMNLETAITPALPEYYHALYTKEEKDEKLSKIDNKSILKNFYLNNIIKPIISI